MYTKTKKGVVNFDGQAVGYELSRLTVEEGREFKNGGEAVEAAFRKHLVHLDDVRDANGDVVPREEVLTKFYFRPLINAIIAELTETGSIPKAVVAPSDASLPAGSPGDGTR